MRCIRLALGLIGIAASVGVGQPEQKGVDPNITYTWFGAGAYQDAALKIGEHWLTFDLAVIFPSEQPGESPWDGVIEFQSLVTDGTKHPGYASPEWLGANGHGQFPPFALIRNGEEEIRVHDVEVEHDRVRIGFPHYDSVIEAEREGSKLRGTWRKNRGDKGIAELEFKLDAKPWSSHGSPRLVPPNWSVKDAINGRWSVEFAHSGPAIGDFELAEHSNMFDGYFVSGTFLTPTGDYRFLHGEVIPAPVPAPSLRFSLSTFDGAHAFLFKATLQPDGSLKGDFWSGNWWHETWTAVRDDDAALPDAMGQTTWRSDTELDELIFADLDGKPTSVAQALDALDNDGAKATAIIVFGSWCPNCADATEYLVELQQKYHARGLRVLGLAFELTGAIERDAKQVRIHQEHHGANWPVLIAGLSDKAKASRALPVLDKIRSYPTAVFLNSDRESVGVWTGFSGPATGEANAELRERWEALIEDLLD